MTKNKKIVLFSGIGAIVLAIVVVTAVSLIKYGIYRSQFKDKEAETNIAYVLSE